MECFKKHGQLSMEVGAGAGEMEEMSWWRYRDMESLYGRMNYEVLR